jgi:hypothetical protein
MICSTCRTAGQLNYRGMYKLNDKPGQAKEDFEAAREKHEECKGKGCTCQHHVGPWEVDPAKEGGKQP